MSELAQAPTAALDPSKKFDPNWKRFQAGRHLAVLLLDGDGTITHVTPAARRMLEYTQSGDIAACFFSHVHAKNMYQVMRDVADMVCYGKPRASWLIRLRTGRDRWQWVRASVSNELKGMEKAIRVELDDL